MTSLVCRELDRLVRDLVDDVERLERPARPRRLLLDDSYLFLAIHSFGLWWRAARAVVRPARFQAYADADVGVARDKADRARHRDLGVARDRDVLHDAAALALVLDARRGAFHANGATAQANLAADLLVDEGLTARQGRNAELEASALDATEELALTRGANAFGAIGVQTQVAAEAPVDEDQVRPMRGDIRTIAAARRGGDGRREETSFSALVLTRPRLGP